LDESKSISEERSLFIKMHAKEAIDIFDLLLTKKVSRMIVGEMNYESTVFELLNYLPFNVSEGIREKILKKTESGTSFLIKSNTSALTENSAESQVILKGRNTGTYNETEKKLAGAWSFVLGYQEVDITDNFFEIGGTSISAVRISIVLMSIDIILEAPEILRYQTIEKISKYLMGGGELNFTERARSDLYAGSN
jgi:hypothetical protein